MLLESRRYFNDIASPVIPPRKRETAARDAPLFLKSQARMVGLIKERLPGLPPITNARD
ncbi:MAG: hypothetical protein KAG89_11950 [Fulvimarina manganoxydans]|uniref:hypothetical protein n=1 Tax=Fulvimarina manganoxydans TaxID=937218 RepID=UPI00235347C5|nr:hypothetical protein [Fulvimarina manganoxydans]MCK5932872.1 hypothetical protein [Fulvimarina manganoxydans]